MTADDVDSDSFAGFKRRIAEIEDNHQETLLQQRKSSDSLSSISQEEQESSSTVSNPTEGQEIMENNPNGIHKKVKCSSNESESSVGEKQELGFVPGAEENPKMLDSETEEVSVCDSVPGPLGCEGSGVDFARNVNNFGKEAQITENRKIGFVADVEQKHEVFDSLEQETDETVKDAKDSHEVDTSVAEVEMGSVIEGGNKEVLFTIALAYDENKELSMGKGMESESFLEAEKKRLLVELEVGTIFEGKTHVEKVTGFGSPELGSNCQEVHELVQNDGIRGIDGPVRCSLKIEVVDDTALIESVPVPKIGNACVKETGIVNFTKNTKRNGKKNEQQEADAKKVKRTRRKEKYMQRLLWASERQKNAKHIAEVQNSDRKIGDGTKRIYSREEMEALRFVDIVEQRKIWRDIYNGLGHTVLKEYEDLASAKHQKHIRLNFDPRPCFGRKEEAPSEVCLENLDDELEIVEDSDIENVHSLDPACSHSVGGEGASMVLGAEYSEDDDSDQDYASIQRPAFLVEGEPDFDSGPPEDGLEYLRRVRWEAAQIPKVKVAKLDKSKYNKEQSIYMPQIPDIARCPEHLLPLKQWEDAFLADFSELRLVLSRLEGSSAKISGKLQPMFIVHKENHSCQLPESIILEKFNNLRTNEVQSYQPLDNSSLLNTDDQLSISNTEDNEIPPSLGNPSPKTSAIRSSSNNPTLSTILRMESVARVSMLRKHISLVETMSTISKDDCVWLFALCTAVDTPLDADTSAALRSLLRKCASLRAGKSELDDEVVMLNILATISGKYFGQLES